MEYPMNKLILAAAALIALTASAQAQVRLASEAAYPPYNYVDDAGNVAGFDIDVGNEICKRAGLECVWVINEWDTLIPNLQAGNFDAIVSSLSITEDRKKTVDFTQEYFPPDPSTFAALAGKSFDFDNLSDVRIGAQTGTIQAGHLDTTYKTNNTILSFDTPDQGLADLNAGNIDLLFAEKSYLAETLAGTNGALELVGPEVAIGDGVAAGLRKGDALLAKFDEALTAMKEDGTLDALIVLYFPEREGGPFYGTE